MAKGGGSQLAQLKTALSQAGLNRKPQAGKKRKRSQSREPDNEKRVQKLDAIKQKLNPFDIKVTKLKHDVGGRKLKGVTGKPQQSKQAGIEQRTKTLLKEYQLKDHAGGIIDRRIGEDDPNMSVDERMLERFTKERQRTSRGAAFNLEDEDELTHYGQSLSNLDDFDDVGLGLRDEDDDEDGKIDGHTVKHAHFGGFEDDEDENEDGPPRKKSKAEVMAEVVAKSKHHKHERQMERQQDDETRHQLDEELGEIRSLLFAQPGKSDVVKALTRDEDKSYDVNVMELVMDKRAKPKDRTKTEEELALEAKETLEKAERKRQKRMLGEDDASSDDDVDNRKRGRGGADDLEDDFQSGGPAWDDLGGGLGGEEGVEGSGVEQAEKREGLDEGKGDEDDAMSDDDLDDDEAVGSDGSEGSDLVTAGSKATQSSKPRSSGTSNTASTQKDLPFTFPCPETHDEFLTIVEEIPDDQIPTVVQRIRTLYHPSIGVDNKRKMQALTGVLIDYILHIAAPPKPRMTLLHRLIPHIHALSNTYPSDSANDFITKLKLMQKNLTRGLAQGPTNASARTWPGAQELSFLWLISYVWPTSDMNHQVVSPARLLMASYLGLCRVRSLSDIASGLFLCTSFLRYEELSKRFVPEAFNFLLSSVAHLGRHRFKDVDALPGMFSCPDFNSSQCRSLKVSKDAIKTLALQSPNLLRILSSTGSSDEQDKMDLLGVSIDLIGKFAEMYKPLDGFIELARTGVEVLEGLRLDSASPSLKSKTSGTIDAMTRMLKFAQQAREPLLLQQHKPIPIATYVPKFESSKSNYLRRNDPDQEQAEHSKLRYQYKQERKGAIRELRKDSRFLSNIKHKEQQEKDQAYKDRMNRVFNSLEGERAEQKMMDKEKMKDKKRAGRR